jgi:hypothetical protein
MASVLCKFTLYVQKCIVTPVHYLYRGAVCMRQCVLPCSLAVWVRPQHIPS